MKKLALLLAFSSLFHVKQVWADTPHDDGRNPQNYTSGAVFIASNTSVVSTKTDISSRTAVQLGYVIINTAGSSSKLEIFNTRVGTITVAGLAPQRVATIDTTSKVSLPYLLFLGSGCYINNTGSPAADVTIGYLPMGPGRK